MSLSRYAIINKYLWNSLIQLFAVSTPKLWSLLDVLIWCEKFELWLTLCDKIFVLQPLTNLALINANRPNNLLMCPLKWSTWPLQRLKIDRFKFCLFRGRDRLFLSQALPKKLQGGPTWVFQSSAFFQSEWLLLDLYLWRRGNLGWEGRCVRN